MKGKLFSCLVLMFLSISMVAQKVPVSGTVSDQTGPVIGASVIEKGTTNGTMTDNDGHFTLTVSKGAVIEISSIGYKTQEITVGAQTNFTVTLSEDNEFLDEVVVVGYGSMKKSDLAGASVSMKESDLKGSIISSLDQSRCHGCHHLRSSWFFIFYPRPRSGDYQCQCGTSLRH